MRVYVTLYIITYILVFFIELHYKTPVIIDIDTKLNILTILNPKIVNTLRIDIGLQVNPYFLISTSK